MFNADLQSTLITLKFRDYSYANIERFRNIMLNEFQTFEPPLDNVNDYTQYLIDFLFTLMKKYFPMKTKTLTQKRQEAPWLTVRIISCIRKNNWHRLFDANFITARSYNSFCSTLRFVLNLAEKGHSIRKFNGLGNGPKKWKSSIVSSITKWIHFEWD